MIVQDYKNGYFISGNLMSVSSPCTESQNTGTVVVGIIAGNKFAEHMKFVSVYNNVLLFSGQSTLFLY